MMSTGTLNVHPLITNRFSIEKASDVYGMLDDSSALGILFQYPRQEENVLRKQSINLLNHNSDLDNYVLTKENYK